MPYLRIILKDNLEKVFRVRDGMLIGRQHDSDLQILDSTVSREHALLTVSEAGVKIVDKSSGNGVTVNGEKIKEKLLSPGDEIRLGRIDLIFELEPAAYRIQKPVDIAEKKLTSGIMDRLAAVARIGFIFPTEEVYLDQVVAFGERFALRHELPEQKANELLMAFKEAVGNAARHGNRGDPQKSVRTAYFNKRDRMIFSVQDEGKGFDFYEVLEFGRVEDAVAAARERHKAGQLGGLGVRMIVNSVDKVEYFHEGSNVVMTKLK